MPQGVLSYQYEEEKKEAGLTALAGLPVYLDLLQALGFGESVQKYLGVRGTQGYTDGQMLTALVLLNLAGGDCVDDLRVLEGDEGFCRVLRRVELQGMPGMKRRERRARERRWRQERRRAVPSPSAAFRYLAAFHDEEQENLRQDGKAFIPSRNEPLRGLAQVNRDLVARVQSHSPESLATLDLDATLVSTQKKQSLYSYKGFMAYQPLNVYWAEQELLLFTEFRDGNVPAGFEILRVLQEALELLPEGVKQVRLRSDTAAYQHDLLRYCELKKNQRFGRLEFTVGCNVTSAFKQAVMEVEESAWRKLPGESEREWAEVCFVPDAVGHSKKGPAWRYLATREVMRQAELPGLGLEPILPFPTMTWNTRRYKVFGLVTNMSWPGEELIPWHYQRCGKSEAAHSVMKEDLAGGKLPSGDFGENAAWWWIMILALNLNAAMKRLVLKGSWVSKRLKAVRFGLINLAGRVLERARTLIIRLCRGHPSFTVLLEARGRIAALAAQPSG